MADYAPPSGPPPPRVPEGWKAVFNDQYKEWFYVNIYTKQSTWEKPTAPAPHPGADYTTPAEPPPGYAGGGGGMISSDTKKQPLESNNTYGGQHTGDMTESDAALAARLQAEEDARVNAGGRPGSRSPNPATRGTGDNYYGQGGAGYPGAQEGSTAGYGGAQQLPPRPEEQSGSRGLFSKLLGKGKSSQNQQGYGQQGGYGGYGSQQGYGGGYPQQGYGGGYGGQQQYMQQQQPRRSGLGAGGGAALGLGGGLLGGMMLGEAMGGGGGYGGDGGGDYGGGDDGGGGGGDGGGGGGF